YPGLPTFPQHELAKRQMKGFGGVLSFELAGGYDAAVRFAEGVEVASLAVSLGGVETLVEHAASITHGMLSREERAAAGIEEGLLRVSVGLEDLEDLKADFAQALA
ncbi:MAG: PLP-dependent transferase, partial [Thermoplasmata archaeon]|nr:PLP-dependent transferase [Thermoplasmata archaeon]